MKAISAGLIDARMDQASQAVTVTRSVQRDFSPAQWGELKDKLERWGGNISAMLAALERE